MKKIYLFVLLVMIIFFVGCDDTIKNVVAINISNIEMSSEVEEIIYTINIVNEELITKDNSIKQFNYYYSFEKLDKKDLLKLEQHKINDKELVHKISFDESKYKSDLSIIFEIELAKDGYIYSKVKHINISALAKEEYLKDNKNKIAEAICNPNRIYFIDLTIDVNGKQGNGERDAYYYAYTNNNYEKIILTITLKDEYFFSESFVFTFNGEKIDNSKFSIEDNVLTYIFKDPNWSIIV